MDVEVEEELDVDVEEEEDEVEVDPEEDEVDVLDEPVRDAGSRLIFSSQPFMLLPASAKRRKIAQSDKYDRIKALRQRDRVLLLRVPLIVFIVRHNKRK